MASRFRTQRWRLPHGTSQSMRMWRTADNSCSSSVDSCSRIPSPSSSSSSGPYPDEQVNGHAECGSRKDLSTDLRLGLTIPPHDDDPHDNRYSSSTSTQREKQSYWPPIKPLLRNTLVGKSSKRSQASLFVKVYMEGILIGRKLDLYAFDGYEALLATLSHMFRTTILCPGDADVFHSGEHHVLTYEDKEGDWMMVGDIPWEMFLNTVKRLKITRADRC